MLRPINCPTRLFLSLACVLLAGCTRGALWLANAPATLDDIEIVHDISFASQPGNTLDLYLPARPVGQSRPVIVFFYGGRWTTGRKEQYAFLASELVREGFIVAVPDYRKYPEVRFPAFVEDGAAAVSWVHASIDEYGGDPGRLFLLGHSSGAHIAALVAADPAYLERFGKSRDIVTAFAGLAGPYSFTPRSADLEEIFGPPSEYQQMQVTTFIDGKQPPMLLLQGGADRAVARSNLEKLESAIESQGGTVRTRIYPGINHVEIVGVFSWILRDRPEIKDEVVGFFREMASHTPGST